MVAYAQVFALHSWTLVPCMSIPSDALRRHARRGNEPTSRRLYDLFSSRILQQRPSNSHTIGTRPRTFSRTPLRLTSVRSQLPSILNATRPTSLCRPIESSDSTTAAGEASISSTPQLLSTWIFGGSGTGLGLGSSTSSTSLCDTLRPPDSGVLTERRGSSKYSNTCRETLSTRSRSHLCLNFFFLLLSVTTPH